MTEVINPLLDTPAQENPEADTEATKTAIDTATEIKELIDSTAPVAPIQKSAAELDEERVQRLLGLIAPVNVSTNFTKVLLYGYQGKGKTTWACRAPKPLLVAIEVGQKSLLNMEETSDVPVMRFKSVRQVEDFAELLKKGHFPEYETIVLDTFSELEKTVVSSRVQDMYIRDSDARDQFTPEGKDYQHSGEHLRQIAASFRDVERNIVFTCQEKEVEDKTSGRILVRPSLAPKVIEKLGEYCDLIARLTTEIDPETKEEKFYMTCRGDARVLAKSRIKNIPTVVEGSSFNLVHRANMKQIADAQAKKGK